MHTPRLGCMCSGPRGGLHFFSTHVGPLMGENSSLAFSAERPSPV
jgi:hypothetical protein